MLTWKLTTNYAHHHHHVLPTQAHKPCIQIQLNKRLFNQNASILQTNTKQSQTNTQTQTNFSMCSRIAYCFHVFHVDSQQYLLVWQKIYYSIMYRNEVVIISEVLCLFYQNINNIQMDHMGAKISDRQDQIRCSRKEERKKERKKETGERPRRFTLRFFFKQQTETDEEEDEVEEEDDRSMDSICSIFLWIQVQLRRDCLFQEEVEEMKKNSIDQEDHSVSQSFIHSFRFIAAPL
ncbi:hypothetical protein TTHERM_00439150 (macronuclear) [Tetrahymena thermophila SB210]|uniref:Uncharacterized protein n=1 Tax=Tetrahymena thermophila (strain SB210) TaxID=312017 RepID=X1W3Q7_TETTS|nr:hypothetical protein TTHERM_00439150 [Tetrahymena thermophila SB210]EAR97567.2 hypothetical protein TTHERM_00439150 [Tetrahymena thermophila SB210]|eukprot:XP_001017812.2 hypothetical protein TTHERM_00439150 [Tetrahymena thermophila SB210]